MNVLSYTAIYRERGWPINYSGLRQSFFNLLSGGLVELQNSFTILNTEKYGKSAVALTPDGKAVLYYLNETKPRSGKTFERGKRVAEKEFEEGAPFELPFTPKEFNLAQIKITEEIPRHKTLQKLAKRYSRNTAKMILALAFWLISLVFLTTGITFACFDWVSPVWRIGLLVIGMAAYCAFGWFAFLLVQSKVPYKFERFTGFVCAPSVVLGWLIMIIGQHA